MTTELMNPCAVFEHDEASIAPRKGIASGTVVGLFSNQKANADLFLDNVHELLDAKYDGLTFLEFKKMASVPAKFTQEFKDGCDVVVAGFGD
jgi:hypothetical protein